MSRRELYNITLNLLKILKKKYIENVLDVYSFQNEGDLGQTNSSIVTKVLKKNDETKK